ncbi:MAG: hypothetical protein ACI9UJ_002609 [bacterium]|jgi:hypothetical protein
MSVLMFSIHANSAAVKPQTPHIKTASVPKEASSLVSKVDKKHKSAEKLKQHLIFLFGDSDENKQRCYPFC